MPEGLSPDQVTRAEASVPDLVDLLSCPRCRGPLASGTDTYTCATCGADYPVVDRIPVLLGDLDDVKRAQARWFDSEVNDEYEIERPYGTPRFHAWLLEEKFRRSVSDLRAVLDGAVIASVCAGSGMDAEFLARAGAACVLALDISLGAARRAAERARRHGVQVVPIVADAEHLPLADRSVDVAYVHDGLHHLDRPFVALAEMGRVARQAVSVTEPTRAALTRISIAVGYSADVEDAGNEVVRVTRDEVARTLRTEGFDIAASARYLMVYRHEAHRPTQLLSQPVLLALAKAGFRLLNALVGRTGNKLTLQAVRRAVS